MADGLDDFRSGSTEPWTVDVICSIVRAMKPSIIVETGTFMGLTTTALLHAMVSYAGERGSLLYTVEFDLDRANTTAARLREIALPDSVGWHVMGGDALEFLCSLPEASVDVLFLDDDHVSDHVGREVNAGFRVLRPGGVMFLHDVVGHFGLGGIVRAHGGVVLDLPRLHAAGGLGIITK